MSCQCVMLIRNHVMQSIRLLSFHVHKIHFKKKKNHFKKKKTISKTYKFLLHSNIIYYFLAHWHSTSRILRIFVNFLSKICLLFLFICQYHCHTFSISYRILCYLTSLLFKYVSYQLKLELDQMDSFLLTKEKIITEKRIK